jgi:alkanesulfonate monooxygenase SsuD/methylene tetrahydromethanopterin reductase-like flavin-dependent oxidoreductase (luciferase family)
LRRSREALAADEFPEQLAELTSYLDEVGPPRPASSGTIRAIPTNVPSPELWLLGSGDSGGAVLAAEQCMGFAFAHYMNPDDAARVLRRYREAFVPSRGLREPWAILAVAVICAESDAAGEGLAASREPAMVWVLQGIRDRPLPSVEEAFAYRYDESSNACASDRRPAPGGRRRPCA